MEVHPHSHSHHKKSWKSYFWEFVMLFAAVTLSFFVENQREHYIEKVRAREYAHSLIQDLEHDIKAIQDHKKTAGTYMAVADSLISLSRTKLEGQNAARFSFYTRFAYWNGVIIWNRATFEQIKNSGSLRYFKNQQLLLKIMQYDQQINEIEYEADNRKERGTLLLTQINKILDPAIHQQLSHYYIYDLDTLSRSTIESLYPIDPESLESKRGEIRELLNMVVVQQRNLRRDLNDRSGRADAMAKELIDELKKEYN